MHPPQASLENQKQESTNVVAAKAVGSELASVLPKIDKPWFRQRHLLQLNLLISFLLLTPASLGFDASMMNGLQSLETWKEYFGDPQGSRLGLMNAVMPLGAVRDLLHIVSRNNANVSVFTSSLVHCHQVGLPTISDASTLS